MTTGILALIILSAILVQVAIVMLLGLYRRKGQYRNLDESRSKAKTLIEPHAPATSAAKPVTNDLSWEGFREFMVQRREFEDSNRSICSFYLVPVDGKPLPAFRPGQFLTFRLSIEDSVTHQPKTVVRCYSLSDAPRPDYYRISIKRIPAPADRPDAPPGLSSSFFHDHVQESSRVLVKAPSGHFHLMEDEPLPIVLIGGGIGITPMLSIVNTLLKGKTDREIWLYYGVSNGVEQVMKEHLQTLARTHDNFHLHVCYSAPNENDLEGDDYQHTGRVAIPLLRTTLKLMRYQFYVCGPGPMMESLVPALQDWGVDSGDIYYESFGPASLSKHHKTPLSATTQPITVTFSRSGKSLLWDFDADSLLEFADANDIEIESGCRAGSCGTCQTAMKIGEVDYNQEPDADVAPGHCLLCISTPTSDLTLDA
ncbi:MAG: ferredoxin-NADP reductase [Gammaproteobacteria bacterium]|jgi:ferredoxin-NADP reductase